MGQSTLENRTDETGQDGLAVTIERLNALLNDEEDEDFLPPNAYAFSAACLLLKGANAQMKGSFPSGSPSADGAGGLRIEWQRSPKEVRLILAPKIGGRTYIYHESGDEYATENSVTAETLAFWLEWLLTA